MMGWIEHDHVDAAALVAEVADAFEPACAEAIRTRGRAWLALAGGRTPLPVYARLAASPHAAGIVAIPTDERCVPHAHPACNLRALRAAFAPARHSREGEDAQGGDPALRGNDERGGPVQRSDVDLASGTGIRVRAITREDGDIDASLELARRLLAAHPEPFDAVLLGMGADGHFASLFPGAANLADGLALAGGEDAIAIRPQPLPVEAPHARISLTLPRLLRAREIHLVVTGDDKRRVLEQAQRHAECNLPVAALLHARDHRIHIHWSPSP